MGQGRAGEVIRAAIAVFNAFRLGVRLGHIPADTGRAEGRAVFNAFRLGVRLGRSHGDKQYVTELSSMPFGWESGWDQAELATG